jgi:PAS domain S-box-containing protein
MHPPTVPSRNAAEIPGLARRFRQASQVIALLVSALGLVVFCGWAFHVPALTYIQPAFQSMKVNTALSFLCLGAGLWLAQNDERRRSRRILGFLVIMIGGATLAEYALHASFGIDQLLFRDTRIPSLSAYPGRMAIATAVCFVLLGSAVTCLGLKKALALQHVLVGACFMLSLVALCGYLYGVKSLYAMTKFSTMGVHTAAGLMATCVACFLARPDEGIVSIAASNSNSGLLLRKLVPAIIVVPILIGWLRLAGQRANLYDTPFGVVLQVLGSVGCLTVLTVLIVRSMHRFEREHIRAEEALKKSEEKFSKAFRESPVAITLTRVRDHCYLDVSESFERWTGWRREDVIGRTPFDIGLWVNPAERSEFVKQLLADGFVHNLEVRYRRKDGGEMVCLGSAELIEIENEPCALSVIADISERKRAQEALKESESRFRLLADTAPVLIWMAGTDKLCTYCNRPWLNFTGRSMESELGTGWTEGIHSEDFKRRCNTYTEAFDRREEFRMEYRLRRHDGEYRWVLDIGVPRFDESRSFLGYIGVAIDVTEHRLADEVRSRYATIVESTDDAIIGLDANGIVASWNKGAEQLFGYSAKEAIGRTIGFLSPTDRPEDGPNVLKRALKGEVLRQYETVRRRKDGTRVEVSLTVSPIADGEGRIIGVSGIARDSTERKRAEAELEKHRQHLEELVRERTQQLEAVNAQLQSDIAERRGAEDALRESESRFRSLFETSPIAVLMTVPDGRVLAANPAACAMFGMSEAEICRAGRKGLVDPGDPRMAAVLEQRQRTGRVVAAELTCIRANNQRFLAELDTVIVPGSPNRSFVMLRDITERKRTEAALLQSEKLASIGRMAAAIAHEINNPLAAVMNLLFLANKTRGLPESTRQLLETADAELRRIAHIARQSLGFYRESNAPAPTSVTEVLDSVFDLLKNRLKAKHASVEKQWEGDVQITAVRGELRQVFSNLVSNSLDAIDERGMIKVRVASGRQRVRVTVTDNGKGIAPGTLPHIFEPFFTTKDTVGTGLGLWVSQQIIEKHGGKIRVRSRLEGLRRGTTFSVVLPLGLAPGANLVAVA